MDGATQSSPDIDVSDIDPTPLDIDDLFDIRQELNQASAVWRSIGFALRLKPNILDGIDAQYSSDPAAYLTYTLIEWLKRNYNVKKFGEPTWQMLVKAVGDPAGGANMALARNLARKHKAKGDVSMLGTLQAPPSSQEDAETQTSPPLSPSTISDYPSHPPHFLQPVLVQTVTSSPTYLHQQTHSVAATTQELSKVFARENHQAITAKFAAFQTKVCNKLFKNGVNIKDFRLFVTNQFPPGDCIPQSPTSLTEIFEAITHHRLWDYFHYSPLVRIVETFGSSDPEMKDWVQTYKQDLKAYQLVTTIEDWIETDLGVADPPPANCAKYDPRYYCPVEWKTKFIDHSLKYLSEVWELFSYHYLVPDSPPTALLDRVRKGCFSLTWLVPSNLTLSLIKRVKSDTNFFQQHRIVQVTVGDECVYEEVSEKNTLERVKLMEQLKLMEKLSDTASGQEKIVVLTEHVKQYQMVLKKFQDEFDALREQERVNKKLTSCLANASEECKKAAYYAEQDLKRVEMEKEVLVKDYNVMAARQEQEVVRKKEVEGRLMEVEKVKHELQKQIEEAKFTQQNVSPPSKTSWRIEEGTEPYGKLQQKATFGGYDCEFVESLPIAFQTECPICSLVLRDPYQTKCCGTSFCYSCCRLIQAEHIPCPTCREDNFEVFPNKGMKRSLNQLHVHCTHSDGCMWKGELGELEHHLNVVIHSALHSPSSFKFEKRGATPMSAESEAFQKCSADLIVGMQNPEELAWELYSNEIISETTMDEVSVVGLSTVQKKARLLSAVRDQIAIDQAKFQNLLLVLRKQLPLKGVVDKLKATYKSHFVGDMEAEMKAHNMSSQGNYGKMINDPIHGHIVLHPLLWKIIDTPEFQRLRNIKQLGGAYYVYPGGSHNRFEHCIGVSYLAGMMVETLKEKQPELGITDEEALCVKVAGLCHDLGHGPFSQLFDQLFIPEVCPGTYWKHEKASVDMFHHMLEKNQQVRDEFERWNLSIEEHGKFTAELIMGEPGANTPQKRKMEKRFLYEIVVNKMNGIDVGKWDYFARDSQNLGIPSNFDMRRAMHLVRVIKCGGRKVNHTCCEGTTHICMRDNEVYNLYEMFHTRYSLHKRAYQHHVVKGVELMITDAFVAANDNLTFHGKKMSEAIDDMDAYIQLTDEVFQQILHSTDDEMEKARNILQRLQTRDLYKCIIDDPCNDWKRAPVPKRQQLREEIVHSGLEMGLFPDDIHVLVADLNYGMKANNPMDYVLFYKKEKPDETFLIPKEKVSRVLPAIFQERHIRVYIKETNKENAVMDCFQKWWDKQPKDKDLKIKKLTEENRKLQERVEMLQLLDDHKEPTESTDGNATSCQQVVQADKP